MLNYFDKGRFENSSDSLKPSYYALFVDLMGVKKKLLSMSEQKSNDGVAAAIEDMGSFRRDLEATLQTVPLILQDLPSISFVAEFSDSAYILCRDFETLAVTGIHLMQKALRHKYPLRGGIGFGNFLHQRSGVSTYGSTQTWSTASFLGTAIVNAYLAERNPALGFRIFIHPTANPTSNPFSVSLAPNELNSDANRELRLWSSEEAYHATTRMKEFENGQVLDVRARSHYEATIQAYSNFAANKETLPRTLPNLWL